MQTAIAFAYHMHLVRDEEAMMNPRQLEAFREVMRTGSITGAAAALHVSQPSVSRLIAELERSVGFALFHRQGRGIVATVEAREFHRAVESLFTGLGDLRALADSIRSTVGGSISLGIIPALSHAIVPEAIRDLNERRPDLRITAAIDNTPAIIDAVRVRRFDLGVVGRSPPYQGVDLLFHRTVPYVLLMPATHPLARGSGPLDLEQLAGTERFITFGGTYPDAMLDIDGALSGRLNETARLSAANMPIAASLVRTTEALAIADPFTAALEERIGGVVSRPLRQPLTYHVAVVGGAPGTLPIAARELADRLIAGFENPAL